jgi:hypothetical protein
MLPIPFIKRIPKLFQRDSKAIAMADKTNNNLNEWKNEAHTIEWIRRCDQCPSSLLDELGALLKVTFEADDDDATKRQKICTAVADQKDRATWESDAKGRIQDITGIAPEIYNVADTDDWIWLGKEASDPSFYWATFGTDAIDDDLGIWIVGEMDEFVVAGNIYIDLKSSTLTAQQIQDIRDALETDVAPAYYILYLGYVSAGVFVVYANGIIN